MVVALEPIEAIRVLMNYGNPDIRVLCNKRPIHPVGVISGDLSYPSLEDTQAWVNELSSESWFIDATDTAMAEMGHPIFGNIILLGALVGTKVLPLTREDFKTTISRDMTPDKVDTNLSAFDLGMKMVDRE